MKFKEAYNKLKTLGDMDRAIEEHLTDSILVNLKSALEVVDEFTGLDMRQKSLLHELKVRIKYEIFSKKS